MKAVKYIGGTVPDRSLIITNVKKPVPKNNQVLVKVKASSLNIIDFERFKNPDRLSKFARTINFIQGKNNVLGCEISGVVSSIGRNVTDYKVGDAVYGITTGEMQKGGWAEYAVMDSDLMALKPIFLTYEVAAAIPFSASVSLGAIDVLKIKSNDNVLLYGASGGVGQYALQILKAKGANVTAVCSTRNLKNAKQMGANQVINYETQDFSQCNQFFDFIICINGYQELKKFKRLLKKKGMFLAVGNVKQVIHTIIHALIHKNLKFYSFIFNRNKGEIMSRINELVYDYKINPIIDHVYSVYNLNNAISYATNEHIQGKVVVTMDFCAE